LQLLYVFGTAIHTCRARLEIQAHFESDTLFLRHDEAYHSSLCAAVCRHTFESANDSVELPASTSSSLDSDSNRSGGELASQTIRPRDQRDPSPLCCMPASCTGASAGLFWMSGKGAVSAVVSEVLGMRVWLKWSRTGIGGGSPFLLSEVGHECDDPVGVDRGSDGRLRLVIPFSPSLTVLR
jgi:hypothetical protein